MMYEVMTNDWPKRHYEFIIDCSRSMSDEHDQTDQQPQPIELARLALCRALNMLPLNGTVILNMIKFGNTFVSWNSSPVLLNQESLTSAHEWIDNLAVS